MYSIALHSFSEKQCFSPICLKLLICERPIGPICGTDGFTYINECFFNNEQCCKEGLSFAHRGICGFRGKNINREYRLTVKQFLFIFKDMRYKVSYFALYEICLTERRTTLRSQCTDTETPVNILCLGGQALEDGCSRIQCSGPEKPVCGSDGVTYSSECELERASCRNPSKEIDVISDGPCQKGDELTLQSFIR